VGARKLMHSKNIGVLIQPLKMSGKILSLFKKEKVIDLIIYYGEFKLKHSQLKKF